MRKSYLAAGLAIGLLAAGPASAHKLKVFALVEGDEIAGYAYFPRSGPAAGIAIHASLADGSEAAALTTDAEGRFRFAIGAKTDYRITADAADGHRDDYVVTAAELSGAPASPDQGIARPSIASVDAAAIEQAVARQIRPLRLQLEAYEEQMRVKDIIGGIGWILGLAGIGFYFSAKRRSP